MKSNLEDLRKYAQGTIDEAALLSADAQESQSAYDLSDDELDEAAEAKLLAECAKSLAPMFIQHEILGEDAIQELEESTYDAYAQLENYLVGQNIQEAATPSINPKVNVVHLNRKALMARYRTKMVLALARKAESSDFKKYKMSKAMSKQYMMKMNQKYGAQADRLTKQYFSKMKRSGKVASVAESKKAGVAKKVATKNSK